MVGKVFFDRNMLLCEMVGAICLIGKWNENRRKQCWDANQYFDKDK